MVFIASTIMMVCPFFIFCPTSTNFFEPGPGAKKFVEIGQKIKKGQTIMIVEAMKTMNHVPSTQDGIVSKILVKDGEPVEFGQPLISVK